MLWGSLALADEPVPASRARSMFGVLSDGLRKATAEPTVAAAATARGELDLRLRLAWGGGAERTWVGQCRISAGELLGVTNLGREPDEPGCFSVEAEQLRIHQLSPRSYSGFDLQIRGPADATLILELAPRDRPNATKRISVPLADLTQQSHTQELDDQQNRLILTRAPGDRLRVAFDRDSLVFAPGEELTIHVTPNELGYEPGSNLRFKAQLLKARGSEEFWRTEQDLKIADDGTLPALEPVVVKLPQEEGVYDIDMILAPRRLPGSLALGLARPPVQRMIQVVVVDSQPPAADRTPWRLLAEVDPTHANLGEGASTKWTDWLTRLPQLKVTAGFAQGPLGNGRAVKQDHHGRPVVQLAVDGWQAYPLPIQRLDEPHLLEIEYPSDLMQTLAISIIEPNAAGKVVPLGVDSGIDVTDSLVGDAPRMLRHRLVFWPRTRAPLVLLANRRSDRPAVYGKISVLAGPLHLPPASTRGRATPAADPRLLAAFFDRPIFPENFGAGKSLDPSREGAWDDWRTFHDGARRFVEYLKYAGYNSAVVTVACEGSAIYPSRLLEPTPKYDSGVFFSNGADPVRKDVLELLLRLFDREGLILIPAIQFAAPLPELEQFKRAGGPATEGLTWIGSDGADWISRHETNRGLAPYYNPLHPRVREAMRNVVAELEERYSQHESFGGLALQLGPDTYAQLPGEAWGLDDHTIARFSEATGVRVPGLGPLRFAQRADFLLGDARGKWLAWRNRELADMHRDLHSTLARRNPRLRLYLASADALTSGSFQSQFRPALPGRPQFDAALAALGLDPAHYRDEQVVLLRPQRTAPLVQLAAQGANLETLRSTAGDRLFAPNAITGAQWYHESLPLAVPSFDAVSPFGPEQTRTWLATHAVSGGGASRQRLARSLASLDAQIVLDGGWMLPLGAEDDTRGAYETFRQLPFERFQIVAPSAPERSQPLVVRTLHRGQQTYIYVVNEGPWTASATLDLRGKTEFRALPLGPAPPPQLERSSDGWRWRVQLEPYDVQAVLLTAPHVTVAGWQVDTDAALASQLAQRVQDVRTRANRLRAPQPYEVLRNPGFELPAKDDDVLQWLHARGPGLEVRVDSQVARSGQNSLRLKSEQGVVWLRSPPFTAPTTGRLAVWAWLKVDSPESQPPLRLAIDGKLDGRTYYRFATVGGGKGATPLNNQWTQYWFQIDDLPPQGLSELRVGFDLMGAGEVWLDDVQIFDLWFYDNERDELIKNIGLADFNLSSGQLVDCQRFLESYWPRFLRQHVPREPLLARQAPANRPAAGAAAASPQPGPLAPTSPDESSSEKTSWRTRVNGLWPKKTRQ